MKIDTPYALATHTVMRLIREGQSPLDAAYNAATDKKHQLGLNQFGRLVSETKDYYATIQSSSTSSSDAPDERPLDRPRPDL